MKARIPKCMMNIFVVKGLGIITVGIYLMMPTSIEAALTAREVTGQVNVTEEVSQTWLPLVAEDVVEVGKLVRTEFDSSSSLLGEDGSLLYIDESTQVVIREFTFDPTQQIRIARFSILEGTVMANAAHLDYPTNIFDVETPTVTASFKFSQAKFTVDSEGNTEITLLNGKFEIEPKELRERDVRIIHSFNDGIKTEVHLQDTDVLRLEIRAEGLHIENLGSREMNIKIGEESIMVPPKEPVRISTDDGEPVIHPVSEPEQGMPEQAPEQELHPQQESQPGQEPPESEASPEHEDPSKREEAEEPEEREERPEHEKREERPKHEKK